LAFQSAARPPAVVPSKSRGVYDLGGSVQTFGLEAGNGIGKAWAAIQTEAIARAGLDAFRESRKVPRTFAIQFNSGAAFKDGLDAAALGGPDAEIDSSWSNLRSDG
jgi:hypothetical protein